MNNIKLIIEQSRVYVEGDSYSIKNKIKECGGHWDADRKQWWVGLAKKDVLEGVIQSSTDHNEQKKEIDDSTEVKGSVDYKGRTYYAIAVSAHGGVKLTTIDGQFVFWAKDGWQWKKRYETHQTYYGGRHHKGMTIGKLRRFLAIKKSPTEETKTCWECGGRFTEKDATKNGDWRDSYCGC